MTGFSRWSFLSDFTTKIMCAFLVSLMLAAYPAHIAFFYLIIIIVFGKQNHYKAHHRRAVFLNLCETTAR